MYVCMYVCMCVCVLANTPTSSLSVLGSMSQSPVFCEGLGNGSQQLANTPTCQRKATSLDPWVSQSLAFYEGLGYRLSRQPTLKFTIPCILRMIRRAQALDPRPGLDRA